MTVQVGQLFRKRVVRNLSGGIIDMIDETNGSVIISKGKVVNQERIDEIAKVEEDKRRAATAFTEPAQAPVGVNVEERNITPSKVETLEKKVESMEGDIKEILSLLKK